MKYSAHWDFARTTTNELLCAFRFCPDNNERTTLRFEIMPEQQQTNYFALWDSAWTTTNELLRLLFHQHQLRRRDKKEAALLASVELIFPYIFVSEENVATILWLHWKKKKKKKKKRKWKMLRRFSSYCCNSHQQQNPIAKFVANWAKLMALEQRPKMDM
jgi:hypothetical protein